MESIHGIDVSWIHNTHGKDHLRHTNLQSPPNEDSSPAQSGPKSPQINTNPIQNGRVQTPKETPATPPAQMPQRPGSAKSGSSERLLTIPKSSTPSPNNTTRRNSWLSSISSKFSSSPGAPNSHQNGASPTTKHQTVQEDQTFRAPVWTAPKVAILPHGTKPEGAAPYTPAPPKAGQSNFLSSALRRLSSSSGGQLSGANKLPHYGLCERKVLNIDTHRDRSLIPELDQSKLRRVSFCVDVEIAGGPRYMDEDGDKRKEEKKQKKKMVERGEGDALKHPEAVKEEKENDGVVKATGEELPKEPEKEATEIASDDKAEEPAEKDSTKKKEKKKRSEEERKARKEKKRKLAEANGTLPVELVMNGSDSSLEDATPSTIPGTPKTQAAPTTDPARIYRRCCQLRETPILKKITEQLANPLNSAIDKPGFVNKLDLSGYWLQLPDLVTLGDYLAVVPIKELIMENCGLTDEGVRVLLAGLLAAKYQDVMARRKHKTDRESQLVHQGGVVERVVFKNNPKIGRDGWGHIALFIHMCRSIKCMDLSMILFPQSNTTANETTTRPADTSDIFAKALSERLGGAELELLNLAETGLTTEQLGTLITAVNKSGLRRLGLAGNQITAEGMEHVARYLKQGKCEGLDLGGIDLRDMLGVIAESLDENHPLWALSLANCGLTPESLWKLFPVLAKLKTFRFIDLSHNHDLFATSPSALPLFRRYLPKLRLLKRIHLTDVSMTAEQAIALAEILPESPVLAHVSMLENPELSALAKAVDERQQEEACALYASLMAAVRVSKTLVAIDIDVPVPESSEVVKALAKQVVAYCLRNMERGPLAEITEVSGNSESETGEKEVAVPDVLMHLVGHVEGFHENHDKDEPAPDDDYVIGGTGVVKALGICLRNKVNDSRRPSTDWLGSEEASGANTPKSPVSGSKAKVMSVNLLGSARKIRGRLQPALLKEAQVGDRAAYIRLVFLDQTLERMIKRFEDEYPETRLESSATSLPSEVSAVPDSAAALDAQGLDTEQVQPDGIVSDDEDAAIKPTISRHNSDLSLASKALSQEEGRMLRFGQKFRRDILKSDHEGQEHEGGENKVLAPHLEMLRSMVNGLAGEEIRQRIEEGGQEAVLKDLSEEASVLRQKLIDTDSEAWEKFREAQEAAMRNAQRAQGVETSPSAIVD